MDNFFTLLDSDPTDQNQCGSRSATGYLFSLQRLALLIKTIMKQCYGSVLFIPILTFIHPGSWLLYIPDPTIATKGRGEKLVVLPFFSLKFYKIEKFWTGKEKNLANSLRIFFLPKIVTKLSKYWFRNQDPGSRGAKRHQIPDQDPQNCHEVCSTCWPERTDGALSPV
jgi:hypothetical protein